MDKASAPWSPSLIGKEGRRVLHVLDVFYKNAVVYLIIVAVLAALCVYIGLGTVGAFLFMLLGMLMILWDAHTDPHIPEAPSLT
jgi:hypothetical protein